MSFYSSKFHPIKVEWINNVEEAQNESINILDISNIEQFELSSIDQNNYFSYIRHEIDKPTPNYGAASDLARGIILFAHGGGYFDIDIHPTANILDIFKKNYSDDVLYIDYLSQTTNEQINNNKEIQDDLMQSYDDFLNSLDSEKNINLNARIGNDALITTKNNPFIK